jgi:site-specific recombinase XerD
LAGKNRTFAVFSFDLFCVTDYIKRTNVQYPHFLSSYNSVQMRKLEGNMGNRRLLDQVRDKIRLKHYSIRTEEAYIAWIKDYIIFNHKKHPIEMGATEISKYLTWLAIRKNVAASTQNQALNAIVFLYKQVLNLEIGNISGAIRAKKPILVPTVLSCLEVKKILTCTNGIWRVILGLLYGSGIRCMECLRLRVKDIDFDRNQLIVRDGKGNKDRNTMLPDSLKIELKKHLEFVLSQHKNDLKQGYGAV